MIYRDRQVDEDAEAYDELLARGYLMVPVTCVGAQCVTGFDVEALEELLAGLTDLDEADGPLT